MSDIHVSLFQDTSSIGYGRHASGGELAKAASPSNDLKRRLRVMSIAHTAVVGMDSGRMRYAPLADYDDLDVHLVVPKHWKQFGRSYQADPCDDPKIQFHALPIHLPHVPRAKWHMHFYAGLGQLIKRIQPDVIHLWEEPWSFVALQALMLSGNAAYVLEVDQALMKRLPPPFETIRRRVLAQTDYLLSRSPEATQVVRDCGYSGAVQLIGYGVDQNMFHPKAGGGFADGTGRSLRLGYAGRLVVEKGLDDMIEAMARLPDNIELALMGEGPHEAALRDHIARCGLQNRVTFRGWGTLQDVADFIRGVDVSILLTRTTKDVKEQFGRAILESQSCGVPVIGSTCGAIAEVVGRGGWIVPESDPAALAACIQTLLDDPAEIGARAALGRANVQTRFTFDIVADTLAKTWRAAYAVHAAR